MTEIARQDDILEDRSPKLVGENKQTPKLKKVKQLHEEESPLEKLKRLENGNY